MKPSQFEYHPTFKLWFCTSNLPRVNPDIKPFPWPKPIEIERIAAMTKEFTKP